MVTRTYKDTHDKCRDTPSECYRLPYSHLHSLTDCTAGALSHLNNQLNNNKENSNDYDNNNNNDNNDNNNEEEEDKEDDEDDAYEDDD